MGKNKNKKNQNKNIDVVEEVSKEEQKEEGQADQQQADSVKETTNEGDTNDQQNVTKAEETPNDVTNTDVPTQDTIVSTAQDPQDSVTQLQNNDEKLLEQEKANQVSQPTHQASQQPAVTQEQPPISTQSQETVVLQPQQPPKVSQNQQEQIQQVSQEQPPQPEQQPEVAKQEAQPVSQVTEEVNVLSNPTEEIPVLQQSQQNPKEEVEKEILKIEQNVVNSVAAEQTPILTTTENEVEVHPENVQTTAQLENPAEVQKEKPVQIETNVQKIEQVQDNAATPIQKQEPAQLNYRHELEDGLNLVGKVVDQIVFQNPLAHQQEAHGAPEFTDKFSPVAFHLMERILQQINVKTPEKGTPERKKPSPRNTAEILQEIKQSAESIDPDPLDLEESYQDSKVVPIIKSLHSESDQEQKKRHKQHEQQSRKSSIASSQQGSRSAILHPPQNPTYTNPLPIISTEVPLPPVPPAQNPVQNQILTQKSLQQEKHELNFDEINKQMLKQREVEWQAMQQRQLESIRSANMIVHAEAPSIEVEPVQPNIPEKLPYTNNLPIISHERHEQQKQTLSKQQAEIKEQLKQNERLRKDIGSDNPLKKLGFAALVAGAFLGACVYGKLDKKIAAGVSIASFILSYRVQK